MRRIGVDANVLVSFLTDREPTQLRRARTLFAEAEAGAASLILPQAALTETAFVLSRLYGVSDGVIASSFKALLEIPNVAPAHVLSWDFVFEHWPTHLRHFGDALVVATAAEAGASELATFDRALTRRLPSLGFDSTF